MPGLGRSKAGSDDPMLAAANRAAIRGTRTCRSVCSKAVSRPSFWLFVLWPPPGRGSPNRCASMTGLAASFCAARDPAVWATSLARIGDAKTAHSGIGLELKA
jgi:hypothetical protein